MKAALEQLSHDELRAKTAEFKAKIAEARKPLQDEIDQLLKDAEATEDIDQREDIYESIDKIKDDIYEITEGVLNDIMAEAFAVVKETAKRFVHNTEISVQANEFDRLVSGDKDYVSLTRRSKPFGQILGMLPENQLLGT